MFSGRTLQRYLAYLRIIFATGTAVLFLLVAILYEPQTIVQSGTALWATAVTSTDSLTIKILFIAMPVVIAILVAYLRRYFPRISNWIGIFFTIAFVTVYIGSTYLPHTALFIVALGGGVLALIFRHINTDVYHIVATSLTGGCVFSSLVTRFYYLPLWIGILLALGGSALGIIMQRYEYRKEQKPDA